MIIGVAIAAVVIGLSTRRVSITLYAVITVACTICSVLAVLVFNGWEIGTTESIIVSITAGFSVDYVVRAAITSQKSLVVESHDTNPKTRLPLG